MTRYIDVEPLIRRFTGGESMKSVAESIADERFVQALNNEPTADVVEVKHGYWEEIKCGDGIFDYCFKCSNCGKTTPPKAFPVAPDYCPNCPAKMDGERK